jgi:hypothetical protein
MAGVLNLLVRAYPQIMLNPLLVPLNKILHKLYPQMKKWQILGTKKTRMGSFLVDLKVVTFLQSACVPPVNLRRTHRGTRTPGWESLVYAYSKCFQSWIFTKQENKF